MDQDSLQHYGILGMQWGKSKYQYSPDSSSGKRYEKYINSGMSAKAAGKKVELEDMGKSKAILDASSMVATTAKNAHDSKVKSKAQKIAKGEASQLSDAELQSRVKRMGLEQQYSKLSSEQTTKGQEKMSAFLNTATTTLNVTAAALSVALMVKQLNAAAD